MNEDEYTKKSKEIRDRHNREQRKLSIEYALSNNPYHIGDIIEDHYHRIRINSIGVYNHKCCIYYGTELTKKNIPTKRQTDPQMYQSNVIMRVAGEYIGTKDE